jgi:hypothetical protein
MKRSHGWWVAVIVVAVDPYLETVHNETAVVHREPNAFAQEPTHRMPPPSESIQGFTAAGATATAAR